MSAEARFTDQVSPERWRQVKSIFEAALELDPEDRVAYLDTTCSGDEALRERVDSLLSSDEQGWDLLEKPAFEAAADLLAEDQAELFEDEQIGHYKVLGLLGAGGMGEVYLAEDTILGRKIALKILPAGFIRSETRLQRFQQEARAASTLNHPNIVTIYEITEFEGRHFIATEFIEGETLRQRLKQAPLILPETLEIAIQIASALSAAHRAGIVHRDIKPENIMLRPDGYVKVLDFGLAKLTDQHEPVRDARGARKVDVSSGLVMGTVKYMSPEQARGVKLDGRSDLFSLGVVLYEMLTGHAPFKGEAVSDLVAAILNEEPAPLRRFLPNAPDRLQHIVNKALHKDIKERYQTAGDFLGDLRSSKEELELEVRLQKSGGSSAPVSTGGGQSAVPTADKFAISTQAIETASSAEYLASEIRRHKSWTAMALVILLISAAAIGYVTYKSIASKSIRNQSINLSRLTASGNASNAAISPDGNYLAYVASVGGQESVWLRQIAANSNVQIIEPGLGGYRGLIFSPDENYLYYFGSTKADLEPALYQMTALGGVPRKLIANISNSNGAGPITFSPDGKRLAFVREYPSGENALCVANVDGTEERKLATRKDSGFFSSAAWSPDGKKIACTGGSLDSQDQKTYHADLVEIGIDDGIEKAIPIPEFVYLGEVVWLADGSGLLVTARDQKGDALQIWQFAYPSGKARRISADLGSYLGLSLTADSSALVSTRGEETMNIWTQPGGDAVRAKQITSGAATKDGWDGVCWTPDDKIVYSSQASGHQDIWIMDADGSNKKQLTVDLGSDYNGLSVSPDGRYIVFVSERSGRNIWRVDIDGRNAKQLTDSGSDLNPIFWSDGKWVRYASWATGMPVPWKVPVDGGEPLQLTGAYVDMLRQSPDGELIAYISSDDQSIQNKIGVRRADNGEPILVFDLPGGAVSPLMQWTPDGPALTFVVKQGGVSNIWSQPLNGSPPQQLTDFKSDSIAKFAWSRDGKQLAIARGVGISDVVLIKDFQ